MTPVDYDNSLDGLLPLSSASLHILLTLANGERHGYAIMQEVQQATAGCLGLGPATLYRSLRTLLEQNMVAESHPHPALHPAPRKQRRRYYRLTACGRLVLVADLRRLAELVELAQARGVLRAHPGADGAIRKGNPAVLRATRVRRSLPPQPHEPLDAGDPEHRPEGEHGEGPPPADPLLQWRYELDRDHR